MIQMWDEDDESDLPFRLSEDDDDDFEINDGDDSEDGFHWDDDLDALDRSDWDEDDPAFDGDANLCCHASPNEIGRQHRGCSPRFAD